MIISSITGWLREYRFALGLSLVMAVISYYLQLEWCQSSLQQSEQIWKERLDYHLTLFPFSIRYLTSYATIFLERISSLSIRDSFILIHFTLFTALGPAFFFYLRQLKYSITQSNWGVFLLYLCYPVMAAQIQPMHTWDDMWVYLFLALSFGFLVKSKLLISALLFTLAVFAREQTLTFYPLLFYGAWTLCGKTPAPRRFFYTLLPLIIYLPFYIYVYQEPDPDRFRCIIFNFENPLRTSDTIFSFLVSFGFIWVASGMALFRLSRIEKSKPEIFIYNGALYAVPVTVLFTLFFTCARETRIFFPAFIFMIPLALLYLKSLAAYTAISFPGRRKFRLIIPAVPLIGLGILLGKVIFPEFEYRACPENARLWIGVHIGLALCLVMLSLMARPQKRADT